MEVERLVWLLRSVVAGLKYNQQSSPAFSHSGPCAVLLHLVLLIPGSFAPVRLLSRKKRWRLFYSCPAPRPPLSILPEDPQPDLNATSLTPPPAPLGLEDGKTPALLRERLFRLLLTTVLLSRVATVS